MKQFYKVAEHIFAIEAEPQYLELLTNYAPFLTEPCAEPLFTITVHDEPVPSTEGWTSVFTDTSDDDMPRIEMYQRGDEWLFCVSMTRVGAVECAMRCSADWKQVHSYIRPQTARFAIDNAAMLVYAFATALGFGLALVLFAGIREQMSLLNIPKGMRGTAIVLVTAGLLSLAFMGFSGVDGGLSTLFGLD